jgi:hypothetical protein
MFDMDKTPEWENKDENNHLTVPIPPANEPTPNYEPG